MLTVFRKDGDMVRHFWGRIIAASIWLPLYGACSIRHPTAQRLVPEGRLFALTVCASRKGLPHR